MIVESLLELGMINARVSRPYGKYGSTGVRAAHFIAKTLPDGYAMTCDRWWRIYYDPDRIMHYSPAEVGTLILREIDHLVLNHYARAEKAGVTRATSRAWNIGADCEIDDDLEHEKRPFPYPVYFPRDIGAQEGLLCEQYYRICLQRQDDDDRLPGEQQDGSGDGGKESGKAEHGDPGDDGDAQPDGERGHGGPGDGPECRSGSGSDGMPRPWEEGPPDGTNAPGVDEAKSDRIRAKIAQAMMRESSRGSGSWDTWADGIMTPTRTPWDWLLRRATTRATRRVLHGRDDFSYSIRSRRQPWRPYIVPGMIRHEVRITLVIDTSWSMIDHFPYVRGHVEAICKQTGSVSVIQCDSEIKSVSKAHTGRLALTGGGCTDMRSALQLADKDRHTDIIVLLTDGDTPWPSPLRHPLIVATTNAHGPSWATTVRIESA